MRECKAMFILVKAPFVNITMNMVYMYYSKHVM